MLTPKLIDEKCSDFKALIYKIDCALKDIGKKIYNSENYLVKQKWNKDIIKSLLIYRRVLIYRICNPNYVYCISDDKIISRVNHLLNRYI